MSQRRGGRGHTRRDFVKGAGATALLLGAPMPRGLFARSSSAAGTEQRTLFFNFSRLKNHDTTHFLHLNGRRYRLTKTEERPDVLEFERRRNEFLRQVPDAAITHHVQGALAPIDVISLAYTSADHDPKGPWTMTLFYFHNPQDGVSHAYAKARELTPSGPLPLSGKRRRYGVPAALTLQDFLEEQVMVDSSSHAEALIGLHPDILSIEPRSGAHIQANYVAPGNDAYNLGQQLDTFYGPALPEGAPNMGITPWATLVPMKDEGGNQLKLSDGVLNMYTPDWDPSIDQLTAPAVQTLHPSIKNDDSLGVDLTGYNLNDPNETVPLQMLEGKIWARHDGITNHDQGVERLKGTGPSVAFTYENPEIGLRAWEPDHTVLADNRVQVTLNNCSNWYFRWLGVWAQFLDQNDAPILASALPSDTYPAGPGPYPRKTGEDVSDALFLGVVPNAASILGIPAWPGKFAPTVNIPTSAARMRLFYTGIGQSGSLPQDPTDIYGAGIAMTVAFNYAITGLFMAAGVSGLDPLVKQAVALGGGALAQEIQTILGGGLNNATFLQELKTFTVGFLRVLVTRDAGVLVKNLITDIAAAMFAEQLIDSIPVAGQIARAQAAIVGAIQLAETSIEVACSPGAYIFDVALTHDLSINILPDKTNTQFPEPDPGYKLYYKVSYILDDGTAHVRDAVDVSDPNIKPITINFPGLPRGGTVKIAIGFYQRQDRLPPGQNDAVLGQGNSGPIDNTQDQAPDLRITQTKIAIQPTTKYLHKRKTALTAAGVHFWQSPAPPPPYTPPPGGNTPGLADFRGITVRQGTSEPPQLGYVGYSWKAFSNGVKGCTGGAPGIFDQMASVNTDADNAQNGYINSLGLCGFDAGLRVGYNLLPTSAANIYLDTENQLLRPVNLDPPSYPSLSSNQAFGKLNLGSDRLILHPAGHIISINGEHNKFEVLKLPRSGGKIAAVTDKQANDNYKARTFAGTGTKPGLVTNPGPAAVSPDGAILILEQGSSKVAPRIQAFDLGGNSVPFFKGQQSSPYFLPLQPAAGGAYLDIAVEFSGYIYVLARDSSNNHRLDIFHPTQSGTQPICTTDGVNAVNLAVDFWRSVYTLNYEVLQLPNGGGIPAFTEPSVSLWLPSAFQTGLGRRVPRIFIPRQ